VPTEIRIRQATPADAEAVASILIEAAQWLRQAGMPLWQEHDLQAARIAPDITAGLFFLAENHGEPAGTLKFQLDDSLVWPGAPPPQATYVHKLAVRRRYAGAGVSTALLRWAVERTRALGRPILRLDCAADRPRLRAFYESFGFRYHSDHTFGDPPHHVARYEYQVPPST
jgi:GNAT superfamily N-acetyltransferase